MERKKFTVDFEGVCYYSDVHKAIKKGLKLTEYYGENLDALWDRLTDMIDNETEIFLNNYHYVEKADKDYAEKLLAVFRDAKHCDDDAYADARIAFERNGEIIDLE
ncbi:MAG: barnase inhibitor [Ruminococcaceae bacterium]|nr:barnase inhibitor [Oscillospiraceae bacterium]